MKGIFPRNLSKSERISKLKIEMCPICGKSLEEGFLIAPRGVYWDTKKHKFTYLFSEAIISQWTWNTVNAPSRRCTNCSIMIFSYESAPQTPEACFKKCARCGEEIPITSEYCPRCGTEQKRTGVKP